MKRIIFLLLIICSQKILAQSIDEVLANYETANGGIEAFNKVKTLQFQSVIKMNMMGMPMDLSITNIVEDKKLYRKQMAGMMGFKGSYTLITDTAGFSFMPTIPSYGDFQGMEGGVKKMDKETLQKAQQKLQPMQEFVGLMNAKTLNKAVELQGSSKVEKTDCYKIKVINKEGDVATYYIDKSTNLIKQVELTGKQIVSQLGLDGGPMGEMMGGRIDKQKMLITYTEYKDVDGIKFPVKQKLQFGAVDIDVEHNDIEVNQPIDKKWYIAN